MTHERADVVIPFHPKDHEVLPHVVRSLHRFLVPRPARVVCIGRALPPEIQRTIVAAGAELLDEAQVTEVPPLPAMAPIVVAGEIRTGWYYQQFLKWAFRRLSTTPAYVVWDADTILVSRVALWDGGTYVLERSVQHHPPYFTAYERLFGYRPTPQDSFIINYQIIEVALLDELIAMIERPDPARPWHEHILAAIDRTEASGFSEFETYGYWLSRHHPEVFRSRPGRNKSIGRKHFPWRIAYNAWERLRGYQSVSYHECRRN